VTLYTSRDGGAQWTAQPLDLVGEGQNTPIENIYCMEVVRDDLFYLITGVYAGTGESQTAKLWLWRCECCFSKRMRKLFRKNEKSVLQFCNKSSKTKRAFTKVLMPCKRPF